MTELFKIILTSSLTILGGVTIYVTGQIIMKFFVEPIHEQKKIIGRISHALIFYGWAFGSIEQKIKDEANIEFRELGSSLRSKSYQIEYYDFFVDRGILKKFVSIEKASKNLIGLSNDALRINSSTNAAKRTDNIRKLLGIPKTN